MSNYWERNIKTLRPFPLAAYVDPRVGENPDFSVVESSDPDEDGGDFLMELVLRKPVDLGLNGVWRAAVALGGSEGEPEIGLPSPLAGYSEREADKIWWIFCEPFARFLQYCIPCYGGNVCNYSNIVKNHCKSWKNACFKNGFLKKVFL